jgi:Na+/melibiose symporter-like transporter
VADGPSKVEPAERRPAGTSLLTAFRFRMFTLLWIATIVSNIGGWMYSAAAGWLMTELTKDAFVVSLVQVAGSAPFFLLALVAGALSDVVDKRLLLIWGEIANAVLSAIFAAFVWLHWVTPSSLLWFLFFISVSAALTSPAWQAVVPSLVPKEELPSAVSANSVGFNLSRAVGPALAGAIIGPLGIASPFIINALSNFGVIGVLAGWREPKAPADALPPERFSSAVGVGLRYAFNNIALRRTLVRTLAFFLFASSYWALLPLVASLRVSGGAAIYGLLLGAIGLGAVGAAFVMPFWKKRLGADGLIVVASVGTALALVLFGVAREPIVALIASVAAGASWIAGVATLNVSAQLSLPDWVRGRGLAMYMTVMFGAMTVGSALWGQIATLTDVEVTLFIAAGTMLAAIPLTWRWKLQTGEALDLTPSTQWPPPVVSYAVAGNDGPVLVTIAYRIADGDRQSFLSALYELQHERLRDGASSWGIFEDTSEAGRFLETFLVASWTEHLRQHQRVTNADYVLQERIIGRLQEDPQITHFIAPRPNR